MSEMLPIVPLGTISRISKGKKPNSITSHKYGDTYFPYILIESFEGRYNQFTNDGTCRLVSKNDIAVVWDGERSGLVSKGHEGYLGSTLAAITLVNDYFDSDFIFYILQEKQAFLRQGAEGTGVPHLSRWVVENVGVCKLPLPEQKKIASILTSVDEVIEKTQSQIDKLQDLKKGTMNELLTRGIGHTEFKDSELGRIPKSWEVKHLNEVAKVVDCKHRTPTYRDEGYPVVRPRDVKLTGIDFEQCVLVDEDDFNDLNENHKPSVGDTVYSRNATFGIGSYVEYPKVAFLL
jgi:type I restriction enzyme S subunit